ncbi:MAG: 50S ribosomal protein L3 [Candidatus Levybacteria bacterium]|nr:50S ribosomal protein L3 [Candidatus Levybacteria bacterium]MBP9814856.1 50S ribosomal protein L3 [Candidatus Levybacteria bacterium]
MSLQAIIGKKLDQTQAFLEDGRRIPLSLISVSGNVIAQVKTLEKDKYTSVQLGFGDKKKVNKATAGHIKKAGITKTPRFFREVRVEDIAGYEVGKVVNVEDILELGDVIDVTGTSKGKGYAGVVKKHGFKGGPRTHGQSDRERAPGSSGQTTTPGRVYKGKRMSGRMGNERVTIKNLTVVDIKDGIIYVRGLVPGVKGSLVMISKVKEDKRSRATKKKFIPLFTIKEEIIEEKAVEPVAIETVEVDSLPEEPLKAVEEQIEEIAEPTETTKEEDLKVENQTKEAAPELKEEGK